MIFRYDETEPEPGGVRLVHLLDDPIYRLTRSGPTASSPSTRD